MPIEQWLFTGSVAGHEHLSGQGIVQAKGNHPIEMRQAIYTPFTIGGQDDFGGPARAEVVAALGQFTAQILIMADWETRPTIAAH